MDESLTVTIELVRRAQGGNREALERLFARYYERVRRIVRLRLGHKLRLRMDSGDILQETFAAAVEAFDRFEMKDEAGFINWLSKIAERQALSAVAHHSAQKRDSAREVPLEPHDPDRTGSLEPADGGPPPSELAQRAEEALLIETCMSDLPEDYRELIILRDYAGASWDLVAEETGRPSPDAARMKHAKALLQLGRLMRRRSSGGGTGASPTGGR
ncbi:MAG: RNA polymerase sigma factor [Planctomycetota bacterium]|jgi:RNA polymerase sigma-70 factor (ECF subfamily)